MAKYAYHRKDTTESPLVTWLEGYGCCYVPLGRPVDGLLAVPVCGGWRNVLVEFKSRYGALRDGQQRFLDGWPGEWYVLKTEADCAAMLAEVRYLDPKRPGL